MTFSEFLNNYLPNRDGWTPAQIDLLKRAYNFSPANTKREHDLAWYIVLTPSLGVHLYDIMPDEAIDGPFDDRDELFDAFKKWKNLLDKSEIASSGMMMIKYNHGGAGHWRGQLEKGRPK